MTITKHFIDRTAIRHGLDIPDDLRNWLLTEYEVEPYDGFWDAELLEDLIIMHYGVYKEGWIDTTPLSPAELWKSRYLNLRDLVEELRSEYEALSEDHDELLELLDAHNIKH